jgi:hypothetical protein
MLKMSDKTRKRISNLFFALAVISGLIALSAQIFHFGGFGVKATFGIGVEALAVIGLLLRAKDILKWRGKILAQGIQEARAEKYCSKCGKAISKDSAFCSGCGSKIEN